MTREEINGSDALFEHILKDFPKRLNPSEFERSGKYVTINNKVFKNYTFKGQFGSILFKNCKFVECRFEHLFGFFCTFNSCTFKKTTFFNLRFSHIEFDWKNLIFESCFFKGVQLDEGMLFNVTFSECTFEMFYMFDFQWIETVFFIKCQIQNFKITSVLYLLENDRVDPYCPDFYFDTCSFELGNFSGVDLRNSIILNTMMFNTSFVDCEMSEETISVTKQLKFESNAFIDFQTILKSAQINPAILSSYFNINDANIIDTVKLITTKVEYKNVFISFSFKDLKFAKRLHQVLTDKGIRSFFWIKDAPPGELLEDIMTRGIRGNDKILFIGSESSIKSPACQFELSEGRKKQAEAWETILFPIHIDKFLFTVSKGNIHPLEKADEYWKNIEELRRINSTDFSSFNKDRINSEKFKEAVAFIIAQLKL
jgi:uncharacterized protein YjbI with pentapeptide repeats